MDLEIYQKAIKESVEKNQHVLVTNLLYGDLAARCRGLFINDNSEVFFYTDTNVFFGVNVICVSYKTDGTKVVLHMEELLQRLEMEIIKWD